MKIVDGKCPYCSHPVNEKPGKAVKQLNCEGCGRLLNLPPKGEGTSTAVKVGEVSTFEPGLVFSTLVGLGVASGSLLLTSIFAGIAFVVMLLLWTQEDIPGMPAFLKDRAMGSSERIRVFPFELYLIGFWAAIIVFHMIGWYSLVGYTLCLMMFSAALMSIQATRFMRESKMTSSKVNVFDFPLFMAIMKDPGRAFNKRKVEKGEGISQEHFFNAAAEKEEKEAKIAADSEEMAKNRAIKQGERKAWEEDIDQRYNKWLEDESTRLIQETSGR